MLIQRILGGREIDISKNPTLGLPPIGFDPTFLRGQFLQRVNIEFVDILERSIIASEVQETTKFNDLVSAIVKKSRIKTLAEYEQKTAERVRLGLRDVVTEMKGPLATGEVLATDKLEDHLPLNEETVSRLHARLTLEFEKYLLSPIAKTDLSGTLVKVQKRLTNRMVL
jgi:hypothetical protein